MKNSNNPKLSLQKKLVVKLNSGPKNNAADVNKFNGNLPTNPLDGMKNDSVGTSIESYWCGI